MEFLLYFIFLILGFYLVVKSSDYFVGEAADIGRKFNVSGILIGITILAIGTSLPEIVTSMGAIFFAQDYSDFIVGTIIGSNITNVLLVFGIFLLFSKRFTSPQKFHTDVFFLVFCVSVTSIFLHKGEINFAALILPLSYCFYLFYKGRYRVSEMEQEKKIVHIHKHNLNESLCILMFSLAALILGAKLVVVSIEHIAIFLSVSSSVLTLTIISLSTSLPEVFVTISSVRKKEHMLAIGNILGSNITNLSIFGISAIFGVVGFNSTNYRFSLIFFLLSTFIFCFTLISKKRHHAKFGYVVGSICLIFYVLFLLRTMGFI